HGTGPGKFEYPVGIGIDGAGYAYVADASNGVQKFDPSGRYVTELPMAAYAYGVAVNRATGTIYASLRDRISMFAPSSAPCPGCPSGLCLVDKPGACCDLACTDHSQCLSGYCSPQSGVCTYPPGTGSPHAKDFVPVLTRMRRGLFVVGGNDPDSHEPTGQIWFSPLASGQWARVPAAIRAERVLAATYGFSTDALYVLDEAELAPAPGGEKGKQDGKGNVEICHVPPGKPGEAHTIEVGGSALQAHLGHGDLLGPCVAARLWAVELKTHRTLQVGRWLRHPEWDRHWLVADRDGAILLASSNSKNRKHAIARLDVRAAGGPVVGGIARAKRSLLLPPLVDGAGYGLTLLAPVKKVAYERRGELAYEPATLAELGGQL
ncbi:MAG: hypothetical protein HY744_32085, partial [Deltaproteobacteria bacterium]|nr:hypothetical protein [Deltaproteobacteria bacterium]